jgi:hypothetical protein
MQIKFASSSEWKTVRFIFSVGDFFSLRYLSSPIPRKSPVKAVGNQFNRVDKSINCHDWHVI